MSERPWKRGRTARLAGALLLAFGGLALAGCAGTTYDATESRPTSPPVTTTTLPSGSTGELLTRLADQTEGLAGVISRQEDVRTTIGDITNLWNAVSTKVATADPALLDRFDAAVRLAQRAASGRQMAYAVKAGKSMRALVNAFEATHPSTP